MPTSLRRARHPAALLLALLAATPPLAAQDTAHIVLVATTDVHGHAGGWDFVAGRPFGGGLTRAATVIDSLRMRYPGEVVLVDAGDLLQGDPFATYFVSHPRATHPMVEALNALGYDAAVPGNHEFNYGFDFFRRAYAGATFRPVCANCYVPGAGPEGADTLLFPAFVTIPRGQVRVAIAGLTTPGAMVWDGAKLRGRLRIAPVGDRSALFAAMRRQADVVVTLIHSGMDGAATYDTTGVGEENAAAGLAAGSSRPDVVVVGHSHRQMRDSVLGGVHFVQPKNFAQSLSVVHLSLRRAGAGWRLDGVRAELVPLAAVPEDPRLSRRLEPMAAAVRTWTQEVVGSTTGELAGAAGRTGATPLVDWVLDVERQAAHADLASTAAFDPRRGLPAGDVRRADLFGIYPYENTLKAIRISGAALRAYLEQSARYYVVGADGRLRTDPAIPGFNFDIVGGADYDLDLDRPAGQRVTRLTVRGRAVAPTDSFTLALNDYRAGGGGGFTMLAGAPVVYESTAGVRDLLEAALLRDTVRVERYATPHWRLLPAAREDEARALAGLPPRARAAAPRDSIVLRVLAVNDLHGQLEPRVWPWSDGRPVGGLAQLRTLFDSLAAGCACAVLRLDAGDEFQGTLGSNITFGRPVVEAFDRIGLQAAAVGNHDLDWGPDTLQRRISESRYPWLAANLVDSATGRRPDWLKGWVMLPAGGRKVAVIGYAHPRTPAMTFRRAVAGLRFVGGTAPIVAAAAEARQQGADLVLLLAHFGGNCHDGCGGELFDLVDSLPPGTVDAVFGGHTHGTVLGATRGGVPVLQAGSSGRGIARLDVVRTVVGARELHAAIDTAWSDRLRPDSAVSALLDRYRPLADSLAHRPVATLELPLLRRGNDYPLGRLMADAYRNALRADLGVMNNGGIRRDLPAGPVDYGTLYELMPFGNRLVLVTLPGRAVRQMLENIVARGHPDAHVAGVTVTYDSAATRGQRVREVRFPDGRRLDDRRSYTLAVPDFLAQGGEEFGLLSRYPQDPVGVLDLDAFIDYLRRLPSPVRAPADPRFVAR